MRIFQMSMLLNKVIDKLKTPSLDGLLNISLSKPIKTSALAVSAVVMFYLVFLAKFDIVSEGEGILAINDSNVNILSPSSGIIKSINVTRGDDVKVGSTLLLIENIEDGHKKELLTFNTDFYKNEVEKFSNDLKFLKKTIKDGKPAVFEGDKSVAVLKVESKYETYVNKNSDFNKKSENFKLKKENLNEQEMLLKRKSELIYKSLGETVRYLESKLEVEKIKLQVLESQLLLDEAKSLADAAYSDFTQTTLDLTEQTEDELLKSQEQLAANISEYNTVTDRIDSTVINSTVDGSVLSIKDGLAKGVFIERNAEILTLKRNDDGIFVDAKFDSKFRPYISSNSLVKMKVEAPGIKNVFYGRISDVSVDSFAYEEYAKEGGRYYKARIAFENSDENVKKLKAFIGLKMKVYAINDEMTFIEYVLSVFNKDLDFSVW